MDSSTPSYLFMKENVSLREYKIYKYLDNMCVLFIPKLYRYDKNTKILTTQRIHGMSVADFYGEDFECVPAKIIAQIRGMIRILYNIGIVYPDITGYNFLVDKEENVWIIDFEHCFYINHLLIIDENTLDDVDDIPDKEENIQFVYDFSHKKVNGWNPYFM